MDKRFGGRFSWSYFDRPGAADAEFGRDVRTTLRKFFFRASGSAWHTGEVEQPLVEPGQGWLETMPDPEVLPVSPRTISTRSPGVSPRASPGLSTGTRNLDRDWELTAP
jgi:hypothetical protein